MQTTQDVLVQALRLQEEERHEEAAGLFRQMLAQNPQDAAALFSLGLLTFRHFQKPTEALALAEAGVVAAPTYAPMHALRANILHELGHLEPALASYARAIELDPNYVTGLINSSVLQQQLARHQDALKSLQRVLELEPNNALALANCGTLLTEFKRNEEAIALFKRLLDISPDYDFGLGMLLFEQLHICDWDGIPELREKIISRTRANQRATKTFPFMAICDDPRVLLQAARLFCEHSFPPAPHTLWKGEKYPHQRIRVAYVSADFREHPVGHLMAGVIEKHDKNRFETIAISLGIDDNSRLRSRFMNAFDQFHDVQKMGAPQIAQLMRNLEVDIAINLSGYTSGSRSEIFAFRPAPIQVNYLGYPGTLGADYIDYILADRHVTPFSEQDCYSEKIVQLPHSYLPTDGGLQVAEETPPRSTFGLPEDAFVFCSFNHDYKISPEMFSVWMRLLQKVENSVLWLMKLNEPAQRNLHREAERHGIDPARLIFATRVPRVEDHLARYRHADLFLDCYPYNAHTTAADALFVGLPVLTYMGKAFQGRVAGSLLSTLEMPELITHSPEEYEARALHLATHPDELAEIRAKVWKNRTETPLYDTELFCRNVEAACIGMWQRWQADQLPEPFAVEAPHKPEDVVLPPVLPSSVTNDPILSRIARFANAFKAHGETLKFNVMEVGGVPLGGNPEPFYALLDIFPDSQIVAFELDAALCANINATAKQGLKFYPIALGRTEETRTLYETEHPMCCSLYKPNEDLLRLYQNFEVAYLKDVSEVQTMSLDTFAEQQSIGPVDFIKIDIQGAELDVFEGGSRVLRDVVAMVCEVEFIPHYVDQPLFGDVCKHLHGEELMFHKFLGLAGRALRPIVMGGNANLPSQHIWSDAVFIRDVQKLAGLSGQQLLKMGVLAYLYNSPDVTYFCFNLYDEQHGTNFKAMVLA